MRLLSGAIALCFLTACGGGGSDSPVVEPTPVIAEPQSYEKLLELMSDASPTKDSSFYLLPDSDDYDNIPQDPLNPLTDAKVEVGKLIYHDPAFATEGVAVRTKTWSCASLTTMRQVGVS